MEAEREESSFALHTFISRHKFDFGERKGVSEVKRPVHVGICHTSEELGIFLP
jgi:hypothetical protein